MSNSTIPQLAETEEPQDSFVLPVDSGIVTYKMTLATLLAYVEENFSKPDGSGGGGINYITNPKDPSNTNDWDTYADAAGSEPVDGTGGSANITWTVNTTTPLADDADFKFTKDASNRQGEGVSTAITIDRDQTNRAIPVYLSYDATEDSAYVSDDLKLFIYDVSNSALIPLSGDTGIKAAQTFYAGYFVATDSTQYRLIIHVASTNASAYDVYFTNFKVGPQDIHFGVPQSDWTSWTPTGSWSTNTTYTGFCKQVGDTGHYAVLVSLSGAPDSTTLTINMPTGQTIDTTKMVSTNGAEERTIGTSHIRDVNGSAYYGSVRYEDASSVRPVYLNSGVATTITQAAPITFASGDAVVVRWSVPVAKWAGSSVWLSSAKVEYASNSDTSDGDDTTSFAYGIAGSLIPTITASTSGSTAVFKTVRFLTPIQDTDEIVVKVWEQVGGVGKWVTVGHSRRYCGYTNANSEAYGIGWEPLNSTDIRVVFGRCGRTVGPSGHGAAGSDYPSVVGDKWKVVKYPGVIQSATPYYQRSETISLDGDFTGGSVLVARSGNIVTVTALTAGTHSGASDVSSSAGLIPTWARPNDTTTNVYVMNSNNIYRVFVLSDGTVKTNYRNYSGVNDSTITSSAIFTITYAVVD